MDAQAAVADAKAAAIHAKEKIGDLHKDLQKKMKGTKNWVTAKQKEGSAMHVGGGRGGYDISLGYDDSDDDAMHTRKADEDDGGARAAGPKKKRKKKSDDDDD